MLNGGIHDEINKIGFCYICGKELQNSGNHQVCFLRCGHIFGFECIRALDFCPRCKLLPVRQNIGLLFFETNITKTLEDNEKLKEELVKVRERKMSLKKESSFLKDDIEYLMKQYQRKRESIAKSDLEIITYTKNPGIIFQKDIDGGKRLCFFCGKIVYTYKKDEKFGLEYLNFSDFSISDFIPCHDSQFRAICYNEDLDDIIASVASDKMLCFTSFEKKKVIESVELDILPWSCCWPSSRFVYIGCSNGTIICYDRDMKNVCYQYSIQGPPFFALDILNENLLVMVNSKETFILRTDDKTLIKCDEPNSHTSINVKTLISQHLCVLMTKKSMNIFRYYNEKFTFMKSIEFRPLSVNCKPYVYNFFSDNYFLYLCHDEYNFSLSNFVCLSADMWVRWRNRFIKNKTYINDLLMFGDEELYIGSITENRIRIISVPAENHMKKKYLA